MKGLLTIVLLLIYVGSLHAEITEWFGLVSFRQRSEMIKEFTDYTMAGEPGTWKKTESDNKTRLGYRLGFKFNFSDYEKLTGGITLRSGINSVMHQNISSSEGLKPGIQEAYINWNTPYAELTLGKIPQAGNAMWDIYAASEVVDWRLYDPRDGVFNDRMSALNGARLQVPIDLFEDMLVLTPRAIFHTDKVNGYKLEFNESDQAEKHPIDHYSYLFGINAKVDYMGFEYELDGDYGLPYRLGDKMATPDPDSLYYEEALWGITNTLRAPDYCNSVLQVSYGFNERDSIFKATYMDVMASTECYGFRLTGKYQKGDHEHQFGTYRGSKVLRTAWHLSLNKTLWGLDIQPRVIWFDTEIDPTGIEFLEISEGEDSGESSENAPEVKQTASKTRIEITATVRF